MGEIKPLNNMKEKTLKEWLETIEDQVEYVDVRPFSHNIISLALLAISKKWGTKKANKAIKDFGLDKLGWKPVNQ